jgi:hypothetical protein
MAQITDPLDTPFSEIGDYLGNEFSPSVIGVGGRAYLIDTAPNYLGEGRYKREAVEVLNQRNVTSNRDTLLLPQDVWRQMFESWHQGAGQTNLDRDDALPFRFKDSFGVDPWTKFQLSLLHDTAKVHSFTTADPAFVQVHDGKLAVVGGERVIWHDSPAHGVAKALGTDSGKAISVTYDGADVIVLTGTGKVFRCRDESTSTPVTVTPPAAPAVPNPVDQASFIAYVKDNLIMGVGTQLWNITDPAKSVLIYTSPVAGFKWRGAAEGNNAIYLIGGANDKHVIHRVGIKQDGTGLTPAVVAATLPDGEIGYSIGAYLGYVFVGTGKGVRMATPSTADGDLTLGALIPTTDPVLCFEGQDRFVWYGISRMDGEFGQGQENFPTRPVSGLGRMDLTTFTTTTSTPAYANDLHSTGPQGVVTSVTTWKGWRVFAVEGDGVYVEDDHYVTQGWVTHGTISFGVEDLKTGLYSQFKWLSLAGGEVEVEAAYDSERYTSLATKKDVGSIRSGNVSFNGQQFSRINIGIILRRDEANHALAPVLTRWEIRTVPVKGLASRWSLPIMNYDEIELNGVKQNRDVREELYRLVSLVESGMVTSLQEGGKSYQVFPTDFTWVPEKLSSNGRGWQGIFMLVLEEIR